MKRIVIVVPSFPKLSESFIVSKVLGLLDLGWDVHVYCNRSEEQEWANYPALNKASLKERVHVTKTGISKGEILYCWLLSFMLVLVKSPSRLLRYWWRSLKIMKRQSIKYFYLDAAFIKLNPDVIHFGFGALAPGRTYLKQLLGSKLTVSFRGYDLNYVGLGTDGYYDDVWQNADSIHLLGEDLWQRALKRGCPPQKKHILIPPAIDISMFAPEMSTETRAAYERGSRPLHILSVGRLEWKKGYEYALRTIKLLKADGIDCVYRIIGDGSDIGSLSFLCHDYGLDGDVHFLGAQPRAEVIRQMYWADVFLHTAVSEGFCNAVIEAQAMQLPVVTSDADGLPENVCEGETGFVVPRRNPEELADRIKRLAEDPLLRYQFGKAGRQRVRLHFQLMDQIKAFDQFFHEILEA